MDSMQADFIVAGATLVDGSGACGYRADVAIAGGRITAIGSIEHPPGIRIVDGTGLVLAPGFIDSHTHDDGYLLVHPDMTPKVSQGVTTVVTGNCGVSLAPYSHAFQPQPLDLLGPPDLFRFSTFSQWLEALRETPPAVNVVPLVGHSNLRLATMADPSLGATDAEVSAMRIILQEALDAGAFGVSTGTFYPPAAAATTREIIEACLPLREHGGLYATHLRDETDLIVPAMEEALEIGRALDCRVVFSHHKLAGSNNHGRSRETLDLITRAAQTQPVCLDCHPYPATSTMLRLDRLRIASRTMITWSKGYPGAVGRDFDEIMRELGLDDVATLERLAPAGAIYFLMSEDDVNRIFSYPLTMVGSDGLPFDPHPHPRQWGTFTKVLRTMVRERKVLTLEAAIHKMTGLAASQYGLPQRGLLRVGYHADLVLLDPDTVTDVGTFENPARASQGIHAVWVNGEQVWDGQEAVPNLPGTVLVPLTRRARADMDAQRALEDIACPRP